MLRWLVHQAPAILLISPAWLSWTHCGRVRDATWTVDTSAYPAPMPPKVDPDLINAQLRTELAQADQGFTATAAINGFFALVLWLVVFTVGLIVGSLFGIGTVLGMLLVLGLGVVTWFKWQTYRRRRSEEVERLASGTSAEEEQGGDPVQALLDKTMLIAPSLTVQAIAAWAKKKPDSEETLDQATTVLVALLKVPAWIAWQRFECELDKPSLAAVVQRLQDLNLVWRRGQDERIELRINPLFRKACGIQPPEGAAATATPGTLDLDAAVASSENAGPDFGFGKGVDPMAAQRDQGKKRHDDVIDVDL